VKAPAAAALSLSALLLAAHPTLTSADAEADLVPITTSSAEAKALYLEGLALAEALRANEARPRFEAAIAKDPGFALAYVQLAGVAAGGQAFFDSVGKARALADKVTPGERHLVLALDAGARGDPAAQARELEALAAEFPRDPRAIAPIANLRFGRQEYAAAVELFEKALALDPAYALGWNQLGYANRFLARYGDAEKAFARYVALVPNDPNPYDSQAELFLKVGKFEKAIASYRRALAVDPGFVASYVGIANAQLGLGRPAEARRTLSELRASARTPGDVRTSVFWTAISWIHEGKPAKALAAFQENLDQSRSAKDLANHSADLVVAGNVQLHAGRRDGALKSFAQAVAAMEQAPVPEDVKEGVRRNHLYFTAWTAAMKGDVAGARAGADAYRARATARGLPFELRRAHQLDGHVALLARDFSRAVAELRQANQNDPWVFVLLARAHAGAGQKKEAREAWRAAAEYNELGFPISWAFVRREARNRAKALPG